MNRKIDLGDYCSIKDFLYFTLPTFTTEKNIITDEQFERPDWFKTELSDNLKSHDRFRLLKENDKKTLINFFKEEIFDQNTLFEIDVKTEIVGNIEHKQTKIYQPEWNFSITYPIGNKSKTQMDIHVGNENHKITVYSQFKHIYFSQG